MCVCVCVCVCGILTDELILVVCLSTNIEWACIVRQWRRKAPLPFHNFGVQSNEVISHVNIFQPQKTTSCQIPLYRTIFLHYCNVTKYCYYIIYNFSLVHAKSIVAVDHYFIKHIQNYSLTWAMITSAVSNLSHSDYLNYQ